MASSAQRFYVPPGSGLSSRTTPASLGPSSSLLGAPYPDFLVPSCDSPARSSQYVPTAPQRLSASPRAATPRGLREDVELKALEGKLQLLTIQRQLSAVKCQQFMDQLESAATTPRGSAPGTPDPYMSSPSERSSLRKCRSRRCSLDFTSSSCHPSASSSSISSLNQPTCSSSSSSSTDSGSSMDGARGSTREALAFRDSETSEEEGCGEESRSVGNAFGGASLHRNSISGDSLSNLNSGNFRSVWASVYDFRSRRRQQQQQRPNRPRRASMDARVSFPRSSSDNRPELPFPSSPSA